MKLASFALALLLAGPAAAFDLTAMSDAERAAFGAEVRAYLVSNPEVLMEVVAALEARQAAEQVNSDANLVLTNAADIYEDGWSFVGGNPNGSLTLVEFVDYRCGYCKKAAPEVQALLAADTDIRYVVKEFPILGEQSVLASRFAIAVLNVAGPDAYQQVHDGFYNGFRGDVTHEAIAAFAGQLGLDFATIEPAMNAPEVDKILEENRLLGQRLQISGTPTFIVGDQMLRGYVPLQGMQQIVADVRG